MRSGGRPSEHSGRSMAGNRVISGRPAGTPCPSHRHHPGAQGEGFPLTAEMLGVGRDEVVVVTAHGKAAGNGCQLDPPRSPESLEELGRGVPRAVLSWRSSRFMAAHSSASHSLSMATAVRSATSWM